MKSLSVRWRPTKFSEVKGQDINIKILQKQVEAGNIYNAYIFCGTSGSGKTTTARIFANEVNKGIGNPIEIDAASNNSIDLARSLVNSASERDVLSEYKFIIIDEAHTYSTQAWQVFLKCIEEAPKYTVFIFCTTEVNKIPETIKNRCMLFKFGKIPENIIKEQLDYIAMVEGCIDFNSGNNYIAQHCNGEMRLAISWLEKCMQYSMAITVENVEQVLGKIPADIYYQLTNALLDGQEDIVIKLYKEICSTGISIEQFVIDYLEFILNIYKFLILGINFNYNIDKLKNLINFENAKVYYDYYLNSLLKLRQMIYKNSVGQESLIEIGLLKMTRLQDIL